MEELIYCHLLLDILINFQINQNVSPLLYCFYFYGIQRLKIYFQFQEEFMSKKLRPDKPDLLHLHHLIFRYINNNFNLTKN